MTDELLAYLLDDLPAARRAEVERRLADDPAWRRELERLQDCLAAPEEPTESCAAPPEDLVHRTCCLVQHLGETSHANSLRTCGGPAAAAVCAPAVGSSHWTLADWVVGGGVLVALSWLMFPALRQSRDAARELACQNNLANLGSKLFDFQEAHHKQFPALHEGDPAGSYAAMLISSGVSTRDELTQWLVCPGSQAAADIFEGKRRLYIPAIEELRAARGQQLAKLVAAMNGIYAIRVGYFTPDGEYHPVIYNGGHDAMLADEPSLNLPGMRSANHPGGAQFVIAQSLAVDNSPTCVLAPSSDNFYLNDRQQHAAGQRRNDTVMLRGDYGIDGRIVPIDAPR